MTIQLGIDYYIILYIYIYVAFDCTFPSQAEGKVMTLNIYELFFHICLAFDCTFPSQAEGKVTATLNIYEVLFSCDFHILSYIFSVRLHFSLTGRGKSNDS